MAGQMPRVKRSVEDRLAAASIRDDVTGCLVWHWQINRLGYGVLQFGPKKRGAHTVSYEVENGPVPQGLVLDHLCRNRACIEPTHLEPVTPAENCRRGESFAARNAAKTHCLKGHPLSGENLMVRCDGCRVCRTCARERQRRYRSETAVAA